MGMFIIADIDTGEEILTWYDNRAFVFENLIQLSGTNRQVFKPLP